MPSHAINSGIKNVELTLKSRNLHGLYTVQNSPCSPKVTLTVKTRTKCISICAETVDYIIKEQICPGWFHGTLPNSSITRRLKIAYTITQEQNYQKSEALSNKCYVTNILAKRNRTTNSALLPDECKLVNHLITFQPLAKR